MQLATTLGIPVDEIIVPEGRPSASSATALLGRLAAAAGSPEEQSQKGNAEHSPSLTAE